MLSGRDEQVPVVPLTIAQLAENLLGDFDVRFSSTVGLWMVRRDGAMIEAKAGSKFIDHGVDKFSAIVTLDDFGKSKVGKDLVETCGDSERSLVRNRSKKSEPGGDVSDDKEEVHSVDRGWEWTCKVDCQVIEGKTCMDRVQGMKALTRYVELLTRYTLRSVVTTVLEQSRPVITFGPYLLEESICTQVIEGMETREKRSLFIVGDVSFLVEAFANELLEILVDTLGADVEIDGIELVNLVGSLSLFRKRRIEPRESIGKGVEDSRTMHDGEVVLEQSVCPVIQHLGFMRTSEQISDGSVITKQGELLTIEPVSKLGNCKDHSQ